MFDEQFPRSSRKFDMVPYTGREWLTAKGMDRLIFSWSIWVLSCELLNRAASYRGDSNVWESQRFFGRVSYLRGEIAMARGAQKRDPIKDTDKAEWKGFIDYRLSEDELAELDNWKPKPTEIWTEVDAAIASGFRFTLTYNAKTHLASCTMIDDNAARGSGGYALSSSDEDGALALKMAIFKHVRLDRTWQTLLGKPMAKAKRG